MIIDWSHEGIIATSLIVVVFTLSAYWTKQWLKIIFLLLGFLGLWLAIIDPQIEIEKEKQSTEVKDIPAFLTSEIAKQTDSVRLIGSGYDVAELQLLLNYKLVHAEIEENFGIIEINIPRVQEKKTFKISGKLRVLAHSESSVTLRLPDGSKKKTNVDKEGNFDLESKANIAGLYEYQISAINEKGDTVTEIIPVEVEQSSNLRMLILAASPQFDLNYLKNYWVAQGHAVAQRVQISKEQYNTSFLNMDEFQISSINKNLLNRFDILYVDISTWNGFSSIERKRVLAALRNEGLGLILKPSDVGESANDLPKNKVIGFIEKDSDGLQHAEFSHSGAWEDMKDGLMYKTGRGSIFLLEVNDSYKYLLGDQGQRYQKTWSDIFSKLYVKLKEDFGVHTPFLSFAGQKTEVQISNISQDDQLVLNSDLTLRINHTPMLVGYGESKVIPKLGWNKITKDGSEESQWFYAHDTLAWKTMKERYVNRYIALQQNAVISDQISTYKISKSIPFYISILVSLLGFGLVWVMEKLT